MHSLTATQQIPAASRATSSPNFAQLAIGLLPRRIWVVVAALGTVGALCLIAIAFGAGVLRILYPAATVIVALVLYFRSDAGYLSFTLVVWFISPLVRRLIDLHAGWIDPSPVLLAPLLVTLISGLSLPSIFRAPSRLRSPYLIGLAGVLYGLGVSLLRSGTAGVAVPLLNFIAPVLFGAHVMSKGRNDRQLSETFDRAIIAGVMAMGIYGIVQYQLAPAWDTNWMINIDNAAFGQPEPFAIRVFSTLNSPIPFGSVMMVGLLVLLNRRGWTSVLASFVGYVAFGLSLARTAYLGWAVGVLLLFFSSKLARLRLAFGFALVLLSATAFTSPNPITDVIGGRVRSFAAPKDDVSFNVRRAAYEQYAGALLADPFGQGIGSQGYSIEAQVGFGPHDSAVLEIFRCLGWFGGAAYLAAVIMLIYRCLAQSNDDAPLQSYRAIACGMIPAALFASVFLSVSGVVFWTVLSLASVRHLQIANTRVAPDQSNVKSLGLG